MRLPFQPQNLGLMALGCLLGLFIGAMPGLGSVNGVAILLPITFFVPPTGAIIFLAAIYYGAMYGGAISSIMLGIPGASTAVATTFDGRPMALQGKADHRAGRGGRRVVRRWYHLDRAVHAVRAATSRVRTQVRPAEEFALMVLAFATFVGLGGDDIPKTFFMILLGLVLSTVGLDIISGRPRLIFFDLQGFYKGISFIVLAIGIYGIGEMLWTLETSRGKVEIASHNFSFARLRQALRELRALGADDDVLVIARLFRRHPARSRRNTWLADGLRHGQEHVERPVEIFGKGEINGVVAPESGQQCCLDRLDAADADARHPRLADDGDPARRHGHLGLDAWTAAVHDRSPTSSGV